MKAFEALGDALVAEGVEVVFGLIGGGVDEIPAYLVAKTKCRFVKVRHEEVAIGMADGYSRATGKIGVAIVDGGPGLANSCAPLIAARMSNSRLIVIVSGTPLPNRHDYLSRNRESNQAYDQPPLLEATVGAWLQYRGAPKLSEDIALAFRHVRLGKGPIALAVHSLGDAMPGDWLYEPAGLSQIDQAFIPPRSQDIAAIAGFIKASRRPVILVGRGAFLSGAHDALAALAERAGALVTTSLLAKNWMDGDPFSVGLSGGFSTLETARILQEADLLVAFGASLNGFTLGHGHLYKDAKIVQVDIDPGQIDEYRSVDLAVVADAKATAETLLIGLDKIERLDWRGPAMASRIAAIDRWKGLDMSEGRGGANNRRVTDALDRLAPKDRLLLVDIGLFMGVPSPNITVQSPADIVFPWQLGRMGVGLHVAAGAALGRPDKLMMAFVGDGGFMAAIHALDTLRTEKIPMLLVVMDDGGFGAERHIFELRGQEDTTVCDYSTPDIVGIAKTLGMKAFKVTSGAQMEQVLRANDLRRSTTLIHVVLDFSIPATEMDRAIYKRDKGFT